MRLSTLGVDLNDVFSLSYLHPEEIIPAVDI